MSISAPDNAVEIDNLSKTYAGDGRHPPKKALENISLNIPRGSFFGLLGPNGAGKSTLINILAGLVIKSSGHARIWGYDIVSEMRRARRAIGVVPQELNIDPFFTPREALELQAGLYGLTKNRRRTDDVLATVGLSEQADVYARRLSGGMRRRLLVAKAMVHFPQVLVLDEPTAGVDVGLRRQLWSHIREMNANGTTILLTTHYLEEAEELCDRIAIINHGRVVACEPTEVLLKRLDAKEMEVNIASDIETLPDELRPFKVSLAAANRLVFQYPPSKVHSGEILTAISAAGLVITDIKTREAELEDIFLNLIEAPPRDMS